MMRQRFTKHNSIRIWSVQDSFSSIYYTKEKNLFVKMKIKIDNSKLQKMNDIRIEAQTSKVINMKKNQPLRHVQDGIELCRKEERRMSQDTVPLKSKQTFTRVSILESQDSFSILKIFEDQVSSRVSRLPRQVFWVSSWETNELVARLISWEIKLKKGRTSKCHSLHVHRNHALRLPH